VKIDIVSIFPEYLAPLDLSLPGKARAKGLVEIAVHDLRDWTHDRHRTTDDTPYGGGAGMVMKPEPWGEALDALLPADGSATVVFTTPSGTPFTQAVAAELATHRHLVFACGRYEGIDQRVIEEAATRGRVREISLGDYVLNGGEVAALAITEAVVRLLPGFMGNPESLAEESHEDGLLEYPVYTKPASWRGRDVPEVLLSGNHAAIAAWRRAQAERRTAERRPDLLRPSSLLDGVEIRAAEPSDAGELLTLQRACWLQEQWDNPGVDIPALGESLADLEAWLGRDTVLVARAAGRMVGAVRGSRHDDTWEIGRLMVAPDLQGQGLGRRLLEAMEAAAPAGVTTYALFTGAGSARNQRMYKKAGYRLHGLEADVPGAVRLTRRRRTQGRAVAAPAPDRLAGLGLDRPELRRARPGDIGEVMTLQWASFDPPLREPYDVLERDVLGDTSFVLRSAGRLVGMIGCQLLDDGARWQLRLLMVAPDLRGRGIGRFLLDHAEAVAPPSVTTYAVLVGAGKQDDVAFYEAAGYASRGRLPDRPGVLLLTRPRPPTPPSVG
jgi:tRNA (guanine37-N1)-methyltransferase